MSDCCTSSLLMCAILVELFYGGVTRVRVIVVHTSSAKKSSVFLY